jgi:hypothetical protein
MAELEIDALQAFEVADLEFRDHGTQPRGVVLLPAWLQFLPGSS